MSANIELTEKFSDGTEKKSNVVIDGDLNGEKLAVLGYKAFSKRRKDGKDVIGVDAVLIIEQTFSMKLDDDGDILIDGLSASEVVFGTPSTSSETQAQRTSLAVSKQADPKSVAEAERLAAREQQGLSDDVVVETSSVPKHRLGDGRTLLPEAIQNELRKSRPDEVFFHPRPDEQSGGVEYISFYEQPKYFLYRPQWGYGDPGTKSVYKHGTPLKADCYYQIKNPQGGDPIKIIRVHPQNSTSRKMVRDEELVAAPKSAQGSGKTIFHVPGIGAVKDKVDLIVIDNLPDPEADSSGNGTAIQTENGVEMVGDKIALQKF